MAKDLIIGGVSNYTFDNIRCWINSIQKSGFEGDIVLVATNIKNEELMKVAEKGIKILAYGQKDADGNYVTVNSSLAPHVERFFHIWNFLSHAEEYRYVITTDVRDVVFQKNPVEFLENSFNSYPEKSLIAASEGLKYRDEPWGNGNLELAFGAYMHSRLKDNIIYNVGIIAGKHKSVQDLLLLLFQLSINRPFSVVDQAVYNFILSMDTFAKQTVFMPNDGEWAVNLGTTVHAIMSGHGDIGKKNDPTSLILYRSKYLCEQPNVDSDSVMTNNLTHFLVHQYDRVNGLEEKIRARYND